MQGRQTELDAARAAARDRSAPGISGDGGEGDGAGSPLGPAHSHQRLLPACDELSSAVLDDTRLLLLRLVFHVLSFGGPHWVRTAGRMLQPARRSTSKNPPTTIIMAPEARVTARAADGRVFKTVRDKAATAR